MGTDGRPVGSGNGGVGRRSRVGGERQRWSGWVRAGRVVAMTWQRAWTRRATARQAWGVVAVATQRHEEGRTGAVAASLVAASGCCGEVDVCERVGKVGGATGAPAGSPALGSPLCSFSLSSVGVSQSESPHPCRRGGARAGVWWWYEEEINRGSTWLMGISANAETRARRRTRHAQHFWLILLAKFLLETILNAFGEFRMIGRGRFYRFFCYKTLEKNQFTRNTWRTVQELSVTQTGGMGERSCEGAREGGTRARAQLQPAASAGVRPIRYRQAIAIACGERA